MTMRRSLLSLVALGLLSCAGIDEPVDLVFPREAFVRVETAQILIVDTDDPNACPDLLAQAELGALTGAEQLTESRPVCEFVAGQVQLPEVRQGLKAYLGLGMGPTGAVYVSGCAIANVYQDGPLTIVLSPTDDYRDDFRGEASPTCTPEMKCGGGCG